MSFNLGSLSINLSSEPLLVAVNLSQKQRMMSRRTIYDVTPLHLTAINNASPFGLPTVFPFLHGSDHIHAVVKFQHDGPVLIFSPRPAEALPRCTIPAHEREAR